MTTTLPSKHNNIQALDALTGGAFTAATSGERASRVRDWLAKGPSPDEISEVFKELSGRDKGAAKPLREKLDELKRAKNQDAISVEWADKAQVLLDVSKLNIADALAWQRDAAKAGAPLSKEPLAGLRTALADRVKVIEDLQHRVQVQREAAVLLAQRIDVLSMKPWRDAQGVWEPLRADIDHWQTQAGALLADTNWPSVDLKFPPLLEASKSQLLVVWDAFQSALAQAVAASDDALAPLPPVPVWADELRAARGVVVEAAIKPPKPKIDPEVRAHAQAAVRDVLAKLEVEIAEGHGKASAGAANALRNALKEHGRLIGDRLEAQVNAALGAATELEGWQRWRADQLREELVNKAEALLKRDPGHELGGRKMQENLRALREQWKQTDQGGAPNHGLWKRFDEACNQAYKVVETWLEKIKAQASEHRAQRLALIEEVKEWGAANTSALDGDWKGFSRILHQFGDRWRDAGHLGEKDFAQIQPLWQAAISAAAAPLEALQKVSVERRELMIEEAKALGDAPVLRVDAVKALQQRWQAEAHTVPLDRRFEQKLWDSFRKPIDDAFNRKTNDREKATADLSARDRVVIDAARALDSANASADAQAIRSAMAALEAALRGQAQAQAAVAAASPPENAMGAPEVTPPAGAPVDGDVAENPAEPAAKPPVPQAPRKPVVAVRGDDRPGMRKAEPAPVGRGGKFGDRKDGPRSDRFDKGGRNDRSDRGDRGDRGLRNDFPDRPEGPRLGDAAFRAQRDALGNAQLALKKLAAQAHGEAIVQLLSAWETRDPAQVPAVSALGSATNAADRNSWAQALGHPAASPSGTALLRLEMAAEQPTPADYLNDRRSLQLQLLTRRNDPTPAETWTRDVGAVLAGPFDTNASKRLQNVLKVLLRK